MPKFTTISPTSKPGGKEQAWKRFRNGHYVAIGWLYETDLTGKSIEEILDLIRQGDYEKSDKKDGLRSFPRFWQLETHDLIGIKNVNHGLFGIGEIRSGYKFAPRKHITGWKDFWYAHYFEVDWIHTDYIPSAVLEFGNERRWEPYGTVGHVYPSVPSYIRQIIKSSEASHDAEAEDLISIAGGKDDATTKQALVNARLGQGRFRDEVLDLWKDCCAVSGSLTREAIRASHIKPWRDSTNEERLDPQNGLPLVATLDALFDKGLISFDSSGRMLFSPLLSVTERRLLGISKRSLARKPSAKTAKYLQHHREKRFKETGI